jgi:hypothetical protein
VQRLEISLKTVRLRHRKVQIDRDVKYYRRKFTNLLQDMTDKREAMKVCLSPKNGKSPIWLQVIIIPPSPLGAEAELKEKLRDILPTANFISPYKITIQE